MVSWLQVKYSVTSLPNLSMPGILQRPVLYHWSLFSPLLWKMFHFLGCSKSCLDFSIFVVLLLVATEQEVLQDASRAAHYSWGLCWKALICSRATALLQQDRAGTGTLASASRGQAVARAALLLKLSHLSSAGASLAAFAPAVVHRHLRGLMTVSCVLCTQRCKAVARGLAMLSSLLLPEVGGQGPSGLPVPLWLAETSLPFNWHPVFPPGLWLAPSPPPCLQFTARPSAVPHSLWLVMLACWHGPCSSGGPISNAVLRIVFQVMVISLICLKFAIRRNRLWGLSSWEEFPPGITCHRALAAHCHTVLLRKRASETKIVYLAVKISLHYSVYYMCY